MIYLKSIFANDPSVVEDAKQYFFTCNQYRNQLISFEAVRDFQPLNIKLLLSGNGTKLNNTSNTTLFRAVHEYIKNTKRFDT